MDRASQIMVHRAKGLSTASFGFLFAVEPLLYDNVLRGCLGMFGLCILKKRAPSDTHKQVFYDIRFVIEDLFV